MNKLKLLNYLLIVMSCYSPLFSESGVLNIGFDIDDTVLATPILKPGDASFTLEGGHNYVILEDDTVVYEYKTGPYEGQKLDKTFIETK